jgi:hypothetical protein
VDPPNWSISQPASEEPMMPETPKNSTENTVCPVDFHYIVKGLPTSPHERS